MFPSKMSSSSANSNDGTNTTVTSENLDHSISSLSISELTYFGKCPYCVVSYDFIKRGNNSSTKVPLILNCKHTFCEDCIRRFHSSGFVICPICKHKNPIPYTHLNKLAEWFTPHYSIIGYLMWTKNGHTARRQAPLRLEGGLVPSGHTLRERDRNHQTDSTSDVESPTEENNPDCDYEDPTFEFTECPEHKGNFLNLRCEPCQNLYCCYCFLEGHNGHSHHSLYKLSTEDAAELPKLKSSVQQILKQLLITQKKLQQLKSFDMGQIENEIKTYFGDLHGKLHEIERRLRDRLPEFKVEDVDLQDVNSDVKATIFRAQQLLYYFNKSNKKVNIQTLFTEAKILKNAPCCLESDDGGFGQIQFTPKINFDNIEESFDLRRATSFDYRLKPIETFTFGDSEELSEFCSSSAISGPSQGSPEPVPMLPERPRNAALPNLQPRRFTSKNVSSKDQLKKVILTHINDINSFFAQKISVQHLLNDINRKLELAAKTKLHSEDILLGKIYGVLYVSKQCATWRRGKIIDMVSKTGSECQYKIFYIDYGNTQVVSKEKLKLITSPQANRCPFAFECKLNVPEGVILPDNAHIHMVQIIGQNELYLKTIKKMKNNVEEVELLVVSSTGTFVPLVETIAVQSNSPRNSLTPLSHSSFKLYANSKAQQIGQAEYVIISEVKDPSCIYVLLNANTTMLSQMQEAMNKYYKNQYGYCIPVEGTDVVVKFHEGTESQWHRGRIISVDEKKKYANIFFVDWGATRNVPWSNVKMLTEEFTKIESQAILIQLADIQPLENEEKWSASAIEFLKAQLSVTNAFKMVISSKEPLKVALFQCVPSADICINAVMVKAGFAQGTGKLSETVNWTQNQVQENLIEDYLHSNLIKQSEEVIMEDGDPEALIGPKQQVVIVDAKNPDLIHIKFMSLKEKENEMYKELQILYASEGKTKKTWKAKENCVIFDKVNNNYARGVIIDKGAPDMYHVYLYDQVREVFVPPNRIFIYEDYIRESFPTFVYKCSLANIKPAGDTGKWSHLSIEVLQKIFDTYKTLYVKKVDGETSQKSIKVLMWYLLTKPGNALEPSKHIFISVNKALVETGVALSVSTAPVIVQEVVYESEEERSEEEMIEMTEPEDITEPPVVASSTTKSNNWYDMVVEDEQINRSGVFDWLPPAAFSCNEFDGKLTFIDNEAILSVREMKMHELYLCIERSICQNFKSSSLPREHVDWRPGMMCTIYYEGSYYRGRIIGHSKECKEEIDVIMIDFGSEHLVKCEDLFRQIMYPDVPPVVNKVRLYDVYPKTGEWLIDDIELLLKEVVTDDCKVVIKDDADGNIPWAEVYRSDGISMNALLVQKSKNLTRFKKSSIAIEPDVGENNLALSNLDYKSDSEEIIVTSTVQSLQANQAIQDVSVDSTDDNDELLSTYQYSPLPKTSTNMHVVCFILIDTVVLNVLNKPSSDCDELEEIHNDIKNSIETLPSFKMEDFKINKPCVCKQSSNGLWRRAYIYNLDSLEQFHFVLAFLVDYGIVDMVDCENVKVMKPEWFKLPVSNYLAKINIELQDDRQGNNVLRQMNDLCQKSVFVEIISDKPLKVHLKEKNQFCYQKLINCGILALA